MDLYNLKVGDRVRTVDGNVVEVLSLTEDGSWIGVRYVEAENENLLGSEDLCSEHELLEAIT